MHPESAGGADLQLSGSLSLRGCSSITRSVASRFIRQQARLRREIHRDGTCGVSPGTVPSSSTTAARVTGSQIRGGALVRLLVQHILMFEVKLNKDQTSRITRPAWLFDRALSADPNNVDALIGSAWADTVEGAHLFVTDRLAAFAAAEAKLTKALSSVPDHAFGHGLLGFVDISTKRAAEGIAESEHALQLNRNLAPAHFAIGLAKVFIGRAEETEAHIAEALRLSPRDTAAYIWMTTAGSAKLHLGRCEQAVGLFRRAIEANRNNPPAY